MDEGCRINMNTGSLTSGQSLAGLGDDEVDPRRSAEGDGGRPDSRPRDASVRPSYERGLDVPPPTGDTFADETRVHAGTSSRRIAMDRLREMVRLRRMGSSAREIARLLRLGPNTERRYRHVLDKAGLLEGAVDELPDVEVLGAAVASAFPSKLVPQWTSSVEGWRAQLEALLDKGLTARAAFDRLRTETRAQEHPFVGSYSATKRFFRSIKRNRGPRPQDVAIPVDTAPAEIGQVDFGYAGELYDETSGVMRRAWVFVMLLAFSRRMFVKLVFDQSIETWLDLHREAFAEFGGVVETLVPDCTKAAVTRAAFAIDAPTELNRSYRELAQHYSVKIDPTPPGEPWKKGKAEAAIAYVKASGLKGRDGEPMKQAQAALSLWNREVASVRVHGSTGRRPIDVFEEERVALRPLPSTPFEPVVWKKAKVHPDSHVAFSGRLFSVPWPLIHEDVWLRACGRSVAVFHDDRRVAVHPRCGPRRSTIEAHLPDGRRELRHRSGEFWEKRAETIGPATLALVRAVLSQDDVLSQLRRAQAIVKYLEQYPRGRAEATSRYAYHVGDLSYHGVKRILTQGLDLLQALAR